MAKATIKKTAASDDNVWQWMQAMNDKDRWSTVRIPIGDLHAPYIKRMSKNASGTWSFYVYRNMKALTVVVHKDSDAGLKLAQERARTNKQDPKAQADHKKLMEYVDGKTRDAALFKELSEENKYMVANAYPWAMPKGRDMEAKGVKHVPTMRRDLQTNRERAAIKSGKHNMDAVIVRINKEPNPKKQGSLQWQRWEIVLGMVGKTVAEFFAKGGDKYGLEGALEFGWIKLEDK